MRPIFLVIDPPDPESLSTRKLVLESAMFNVLTANSCDEGKELIENMPVHGIVVHERAFHGKDPRVTIAELRQTRPNAPVILLSVNPSGKDGADRVLSSHDPVELVRVIREMLNLPADPTRWEPEPPERSRPS